MVKRKYKEDEAEEPPVWEDEAMIEDTEDEEEPKKNKHNWC